MAVSRVLGAGAIMAGALAASAPVKAFSLFEIEGEPTRFLPAYAPLPPARPEFAAVSVLVKSQPRPSKMALVRDTSEPEAAGPIKADPVTQGPAPSVASRDGVRALIAMHAKEQGVPVALADAVVRVESTYNPRATNGYNLGLTQISLPTARSMGYSGTASGLFDADTNLRYGIKYLAHAYRLSKGNTCQTILKYQAGHGAVTMTPAARTYCSKVVTLLASSR
jgi:soluble lytic murein transglycosylase-like protein